VSSTPPVSSACLDCGSSVSVLDLEAATSISYPPSSVARRRSTIVQRFKLWLGVSPVLPSLATFLMFGCFCCGEGWIQLRSVGRRVERLVEEDDLDMFVICTFLRVLCVKGEDLDVMFWYNTIYPFRKTKKKSLGGSRNLKCHDMLKFSETVVFWFPLVPIEFWKWHACNIFIQREQWW
jgi:hypothetical protein